MKCKIRFGGLSPGKAMVPVLIFSLLPAIIGAEKINFPGYSLSETEQRYNNEDFSSVSANLGDTALIAKFTTIDRKFGFIRYDQNFVEWNNFYTAAKLFDKLNNSKTEKFTVLHIGDSHIQSDIFTGFVRNQFQGVFGVGGRGFVFPYAAAKTHNAYDYITYANGVWTPSRNIQPVPAVDLGIGGYSVKTTASNSSFRFVFNDSPLYTEDNLVKIYCRKDANSFDLSVNINNGAETIIIPVNDGEKTPYVSFEYKGLIKSLEVKMLKNNSGQDSFECYGLIMEHAGAGGVVYNSIGVNGAGLKSIFKQKYLAEHIADMQPDLFVLDLGINDLAVFNWSETETKKDIESIIDFVKTASPETVILLITTQDSYFRRNNIAACKRFAELMSEISASKDCLFYDYYNVAGGRYSMNKWLKSSLSSRDMLHLVYSGYILKGELFFNAFINSYMKFLEGMNEKFVITGKILDPGTNAHDDFIVNETASGGTKVIYKVREGDDLDKIAKSYNVKKEEIMEWNKMSSESLDSLSSLIIVASVQYQKSTPARNTTTASAGTQTAIYHRVRSGETLSSIAYRYGVSISNLKTWNRITRDIVYANSTLVIYTASYGGGSEQPVATTKTETKAPASQRYATESKTATTTTKSGKSQTYKVKSGDALSSIATTFGVSVQQIMTWNGLRNSRINAGQTLVIYSDKSPGTATSTTAQTNNSGTTKSNNTQSTSQNQSGNTKAVHHKIQSKETLSGIAKKYSVSISDIKKWNNIQGDKIKAGNTLIIYTK